MRDETKSSHFNNRTFLLHPFIIFSVVWITVVFLYSLHLSKLLRYPTGEVVRVTGYIWLPFGGVIVAYTAFHHFTKLAFHSRPETDRIDIDLLKRRLTIWFRVWVVISVVEMAVSGGLPIVWLIQHSSKTYMDFGITSVHGLVNSLLASLAICHFALYFVTGERRHLRVPAFVVVWSMLAVTRQLMLESLLEYAVVFLSIKRVKPSTLVRIALSVLIVVVVFGFIGDLRSGAEAFRSLAEPTAQYPDWLPSGVLWVYIYITTPINNLIYTMHTFHPIHSLLFPNTVATLFPSFLRTIIYGSQVGQAESGNLITQAFNVSTAYIGPYEDYGLAGVVLLSSLTSFVCQLFWYRSKLRDILIFAVLTQCLMLTLFFNLFFALPVITQVVWLFYLFMPKVRIGKRTNSQIAIEQVH
jgi:oligosaccharide repeat unit polymerase